MTNPNAVDSAIQNYVKARNLKEDVDSELSLAKQKLIQAEEIMIDTMLENGLKSAKHNAGSIAVLQTSFGSINKLYDKEEILLILESLPDFKHVIKEKKDFSVKTLGAYVKELEQNAYEHWLNEKRRNDTMPDFNESMFLPKQLIGKIAVSSTLTVRFTRTK